MAGAIKAIAGNEELRNGCATRRAPDSRTSTGP